MLKQSLLICNLWYQHPLVENQYVWSWDIIKERLYDNQLWYVYNKTIYSFYYIQLTMNSIPNNRINMSFYWCEQFLKLHLPIHPTVKLLCDQYIYIMYRRFLSRSRYSIAVDSGKGLGFYVRSSRRKKTDPYYLECCGII